MARVSRSESRKSLISSGTRLRRVSLESKIQPNPRAKMSNRCSHEAHARQSHERAREIDPNAAILVERVRNTDSGHRDIERLRRNSSDGHLHPRCFLATSFARPERLASSLLLQYNAVPDVEAVRAPLSSRSVFSMKFCSTALP